MAWSSLSPRKRRLFGFLLGLFWGSGNAFLDWLYEQHYPAGDLLNTGINAPERVARCRQQIDELEEVDPVLTPEEKAEFGEVAIPSDSEDEDNEDAQFVSEEVYLRLEKECRVWWLKIYEVEDGLRDIDRRRDRRTRGIPSEDEEVVEVIAEQEGYRTETLEGRSETISGVPVVFQGWTEGYRSNSKWREETDYEQILTKVEFSPVVPRKKKLNPFWPFGKEAFRDLVTHVDQPDLP